MNRSRLGLALTIALIGIVANSIPAIPAFDRDAMLDRLFRLRGHLPPPEDVVVISIDQESADALSLPLDPDRWPRSLHGELVRKLEAARPAVIVFDLSFEADREASQDRTFAAAVEHARNVILLEHLDADNVANGSGGGDLKHSWRERPIPVLSAAALATAPFPLPLEPPKVSQFWTFGPSDSEVATLPALGLHAYLLDVHDRLISLLAELRPESARGLASAEDVLAEGSLTATAARIRYLFLADTGLETALLQRLDAAASATASDRMTASERTRLESLIALYAGPDSRILNFFGPVRTITTIPYHRILADDWDAADLELAGKAVFVGFSEKAPIRQDDNFLTAFSDGSGSRMSGVEIGATGFANLLDRKSVQTLPIVAEHTLVLIWGTLIAAVLLWLPLRPALLLGSFVTAGYLATTAAAFVSNNLFLPITVPMLIQLVAALLVMLAWRYAHARTQGDRARRTLGLYLPQRMIDDLARDVEYGRPQSRLLHGTCLVSDAAQFTALAERLAPSALQGLLNDYYAVLFAEIERFGGFVADVVGDSMVAVWADTEPDAEARADACRAGRAILAAVDRFNAEHAGFELPTRIGVHSGQVLLGDVGAQSRYEYRAVGDIVNTATRIQELNKRLRTRELISDEVLRGTDYRTSRLVGDFLLAGKSIALRLHDSVEFPDTLRGRQGTLAERFESALDSFRERDWTRAIQQFQAVLSAFPHDGPAQFYLELCRNYSVADPGPTWNGTIVLADK